jgi:hypothetical protein
VIDESRGSKRTKSRCRYQPGCNARESGGNLGGHREFDLSLANVDKNETLQDETRGGGRIQAAQSRCKKALASVEDCCNIGGANANIQFPKARLWRVFLLWGYSLRHELSFELCGGRGLNRPSHD